MRAYAVRHNGQIIGYVDDQATLEASLLITYKYRKIHAFTIEYMAVSFKVDTGDTLRFTLEPIDIYTSPSHF